MNERINQLIGQCIDQRWTVTGPMFDREKFAELIVRECASLFDPDLSVEHEEWIVRKSILQHFGVEE